MSTEPLAPNPNLGIPTVHRIPTALPSDVEDCIRKLYPKRSEKIIERLTQLRSEDPRLFGDRIVRCIVYCAWHRKTDLETWITEARTDYRDLIMAAEYDRNDNRIRDFNQPFSEEMFTAKDQKT